MTKYLLLIILCFGFATQLDAQDEKPVLVTTQWLADRINEDNLKIFHVDNEKGYKKEHIKGAQFLSWKEYTYDDDTHVFDFPTDEALEKMFESKGVNNGDIIVLYVDSPMIPMMSRVYLTLDYLGFSDNTYLLDGGLDLWKINGGPTSKEVPVVKKGSITLKTNKNIRADIAYVQSAVANSAINIVDGRASVYYQGIEAGNGGKSRKGHILNAKTIPYTSLYEKNENGAITFLSKEKLEKIFNNQGLAKDQQILLYCHIGMQMSAVYVAAKVLGYKDVKVFDGSFYEWGPDESLPIELEK